ncbi:helix-turn-helix transcriptional regulator [Pseudoduganella namucuonensis]|uniref:Transcriptional regulator, AlpA family n=1 Tax=Pseudoduganella namucuonensis TaxID=1035707 RepID=A0A1I7HKU0_9BURK|nr:AlpA family phage regulatory protein [Pseudoduganella namucuonensis]SFU61377.1 transcriptional regulator, AlpA family [Pseudoduganella namucuonensis]
MPVEIDMKDYVLKINQVMAICGKSRSAIYKEIRKGLFPRQLKLTSRSAGWSKNEIEQWLEERKRDRDQAPLQPYSARSEILQKQFSSRAGTLLHRLTTTR